MRHVALAFVILLSAPPAVGISAPSGPCVTRPEAGNGKVTLMTEAKGGTIEIWRFGSRIGTVPFEGTFAAGCVNLEARMPAVGRAQMLRIEIEPNVAKTLMIAFDAPPTAPRDKAEALLRQAEWGDTKARDKVVEILAKALADVAPTNAAAPGPPPDDCVTIFNGGMGYVTIDTQPTAVIYAGEQRLGETPLAKARLPIGCNKLTAVAEDGRRQEFKIKVEANAVRIFKLDLKP